MRLRQRTQEGTYQVLRRPGYSITNGKTVQFSGPKMVDRIHMSLNAKLQAVAQNESEAVVDVVDEE
jgi:hypothetical protein